MSQHAAQGELKLQRDDTAATCGKGHGAVGRGGRDMSSQSGEGQEGSHAGRAEIRFSLLKLPWATGQRATGGQEGQAGLRRAQQPREQLGKGVPAPGRSSARRT